MPIQDMEAITGALSGNTSPLHGHVRSRGQEQQLTLKYVHSAGSVALVPLTIMPFAAGSLSPMLDGALISLVLIHSHLGFEYDTANHYRIDSEVLTSAQLSNYRLRSEVACAHCAKAAQLGAESSLLSCGMGLV